MKLLCFRSRPYDLRRFDRIVMPESRENLVSAEAPIVPTASEDADPTCVIVTSACTRPGSRTVICDKELWYANNCVCSIGSLGQNYTHTPIACLPARIEHWKTTMPSRLQLPRLHQLPSSIRQSIARNSNCTTLPLIATRQLSHAFTRPQLGALAVAHVPQQRRSITIKQLDSGQDSEQSPSQECKGLRVI